VNDGEAKEHHKSGFFHHLPRAATSVFSLELILEVFLVFLLVSLLVFPRAFLPIFHSWYILGKGSVAHISQLRVPAEFSQNKELSILWRILLSPASKKKTVKFLN
jgi:hypothetical protein